AHQVGALVYVDGAHATPHQPIELAALGADLFATSAYKWAGPHVGAVIGMPAALAQLEQGYRNGMLDELDLGGLPLELLAGVVAAVDHVAGLDDAAHGSRRDRVLASLAAVQAYESAVFARLLSGLRSIPAVTVLGAPASRTPTVSFTVEGWK